MNFWLLIFVYTFAWFTIVCFSVLAEHNIRSAYGCHDNKELTYEVYGYECTVPKK